jgi:hypothetical protein|eukprot:SAG11_NODE_16_length_26235_cov_39.900417_15_plen_72_part_00
MLRERRKKGAESKKRADAHAKRSSAAVAFSKKSQRRLKVLINTDEMGQGLVAWLCHKDDLWHSQAHHLAGE